MPPPVPTADGQVNRYNLSNSSASAYRVYFVNGIRVPPRSHAVTAAYLSLLLDYPVWGVYNATNGAAVDFAQCLADYAQNATARLGSAGKQGKPPAVPEAQVPAFLATLRDPTALRKKYVVWNKATLGLFRDLVEHRHEEKMIIAHSQGNLITSNALFVLEGTLGPAALRKIRVYSLASPSPAWPLSLRKTHDGGGRQDNAFMNDVVALLRPHNLAKKVGIGGLQNAGDFRTMEGFSWKDPIAPHDTKKIIATLNFLKSIRGDLGLSKELTPEFLDEKSKIAEAAVPVEKKD